MGGISTKTRGRGMEMSVKKKRGIDNYQGRKALLSLSFAILYKAKDNAKLNY